MSGITPSNAGSVPSNRFEAIGEVQVSKKFGKTVLTQKVQYNGHIYDVTVTLNKTGLSKSDVNREMTDALQKTKLVAKALGLGTEVDSFAISHENALSAKDAHGGEMGLEKLKEKLEGAYNNQGKKLEELKQTGETKKGYISDPTLFREKSAKLDTKIKTLEQLGSLINKKLQPDNEPAIQVKQGSPHTPDDLDPKISVQPNQVKQSLSPEQVEVQKKRLLDLKQKVIELKEEYKTSISSPGNLRRENEEAEKKFSDALSALKDEIKNMGGLEDFKQALIDIKNSPGALDSEKQEATDVLEILGDQFVQSLENLQPPPTTSTKPSTSQVKSQNSEASKIEKEIIELDSKIEKHILQRKNIKDELKIIDEDLNFYEELTHLNEDQQLDYEHLKENKRALQEGDRKLVDLINDARAKKQILNIKLLDLKK